MMWQSTTADSVEKNGRDDGGTVVEMTVEMLSG